MTDLPDKLRRYAKDQGGWHDIDETCEQAADAIDTLTARVKVLEETLSALVAACDSGNRFEQGAGGMTLEAQLARTIINRVPAGPVEDARAILSTASTHQPDASKSAQEIDRSEG